MYMKDQSRNEWDDYTTPRVRDVCSSLQMCPTTPRAVANFEAMSGSIPCIMKADAAFSAEPGGRCSGASASLARTNDHSKLRNLMQSSGSCLTWDV